MKSLSLLSALVVALAGVAAAGEGDHFRTMDANQDGRISAQEHAEGAQTMFGKMDADRDGKVTAAEMDAGREAMQGEHQHHAGQQQRADSDAHKGDHVMSSAEKIRVIDSNGDAVLSAEEHAAGSREMFGKMDTDRDGTLTEAEMRAGHERMLNK